MIKYLKNNILIIVAILLLIVLGIFCILIDGSDVIKAFSIIALVYLILIGGWMIYSSFKYKDYLNNNPNFINKPIGYIIQGSVLIILGVLIIIFDEFLVRLAIGIFLIALPLITLFTKPDKVQYLKNNFWKFIIGLLFILAYDVVFDILFIIIGICFILLSGYLSYLLVTNYKDKSYPNVLTKYLMLYIIKKNKD